jgi:hypothetical protein
MQTIRYILAALVLSLLAGPVLADPLTRSADAVSEDAQQSGSSEAR